MKQYLTFAAAILFACFVCDRSQAGMAIAQVTNLGNNDPANAHLQLTTNLVEQNYCSNGDVRMFLRLQYANTGRAPIILHKQSLSISGYKISSSDKAAIKGHHEIDLRVFGSTFELNPTRGSTPPIDRFIILAPGDSYEIDTKALYSEFHISQRGYLDIVNSSGRRLRNGSHVLQINVLTWYESAALAEELSVLWREYGVLWWKGQTSLPMSFKIQKPSSPIKCS